MRLRPAPPHRHPLKKLTVLYSAGVRFLAGLGLDILEVWGMTETTGTATINTPTEFRGEQVNRMYEN